MLDNLQGMAQWFRGKSVLITGATGPLGYRLTQLLAESGSELVVLTRQADAVEKLWPGLNIKQHVGSLLDCNALEQVCRNVDTIFHLASYNPGPSERMPEDNPQHKEVTVSGILPYLTS